MAGIAEEVAVGRGDQAMRMLLVVGILLSLLSPAMAESPTTSPASPDAGYAASLTGAVAAGAFVGAMVVQVVATGIVVPALGVLAYEAVIAAGGIGGGLAGAWVQSR
jgi:hypothetical protein